MNNFVTRAITGILFVAVMVGCIWWSYWSMAILFLIISVLGLWEFYTLLEKANYAPQKYTGIIIGISFMVLLLFIFRFFPPMKYMAIFYLFFLSFALVFFIELFRNSKAPIQNVGLTILGVLYISLSFVFIASGSRRLPSEIDSWNDVFSLSYNPHFILGFFFLVWSNDTFAYLVGRAVGKHKLFERISPKKTWEGTIGGGLLTMVVGYIISIYFTEIAPLHWLIIALIVSITATLGDLVESMFKRSLNVKDSGSILPGHGGILDRFDGVLLSSPFVFTYLLLIR